MATSAPSDAAASASAPSGVISKALACKYRKEILKIDLSEKARKEKQEKLDARAEWLKQNGRGTYKAKLTKQLSSIKKDTAAIKTNTEAVLDDTKALRAIAEGEEVPRKPGQSDKARLKQIRLQKRLLDNEAGDLREREAKRIQVEKHDRLSSLQDAAETAEACSDIIMGKLEG